MKAHVAPKSEPWHRGLLAIALASLLTGLLWLVGEQADSRLASQFGDLYQRELGVDAHAMAMALARGEDPLALQRQAPRTGAAASLVYRALLPDAVPLPPGAAARSAFARQHADALLFSFPKQGYCLQRNCQRTGSHRYGIVHLGARDREKLREQAEHASALLGWPAPYLDQPRPADARPAPHRTSHGLRRG